MGPLIILMLWVAMGLVGCEPSYWEPQSLSPAAPSPSLAHNGVLEPDPADVPFYKAIAEDQEKRLSLCKTDDECRSVHFLRGLAALYENRELAALHFRKVVVSRPNSALAGESRFWLWLLDVLNAPGGGGLSSQELVKRLMREMVEKELSIHELSSKLENSSVDALQAEVENREKTLDVLNGTVASLTKQLEQLKKDQSQRQDLQQELKASEKKVQELTSQLEALRRIDQEIREKAPPTRPSEKMTPTPDLEKDMELEKKSEKDLKKDEELKR